MYKITHLALILVLASSFLPAMAEGKNLKKKRCSNPHPISYVLPKESKVVKIKDLKISVRVPSDRKLVRIGRSGFAFLNKSEYQHYKCVLSGGFPHESDLIAGVAPYKKISNPNGLALDKVVNSKILEKLYISSPSQLVKLNINNIDFLVSNTGRSDIEYAWFSTKSNPKIVVQYQINCGDCGDAYEAIVNSLKNINSIN